jgi:hypothetical protein
MAATIPGWVGGIMKLTVRLWDRDRRGVAGYSCAKLALVVYHGTSLPVWILAPAANVVLLIERLGCRSKHSYITSGGAQSERR